MFNSYIFVAAVAMIAIIGFYVVRFFVMLGFGVSDDSAIWGQFGDYMGGTLNPVLSFISIVLLIKSLGLQNQANVELRAELQENRRAEKLRSFSTLFFNMINSQRSLIDSFSVKNGSTNLSDTVVYIEGEIQRLREEGGSKEVIGKFLDDFDTSDRIYGVVRAFYVTVKAVFDKLSNVQGFTVADRKEHLLTLINFTDFAQLRLIIIAIQFMNYPASQYLRENNDFIDLLSELGLELDPY